MKITLNNDPALNLVSHVINEKLNDTNGFKKEKIVIPDECGDTLWDDVLDQDKKTITAKDSEENGSSHNDSNDLKK